MKRFNEFINEGLLAAMIPNPDIFENLLSKDKYTVYEVTYKKSVLGMEITDMLGIMGSNYGDVKYYDNENYGDAMLELTDYLIDNFLNDFFLDDDEYYEIYKRGNDEFKIFTEQKIVVGMTDGGFNECVMFDTVRLRELSESKVVENNQTILYVNLDDITTEKELVAVDTRNVHQILSTSGEGKMPLDKLRVDSMVKRLHSGGSLPPLKVYGNNLLKDGHHRYMAYKQAKIDRVPIEYI